jgi:hypothetical protein
MENFRAIYMNGIFDGDLAASTGFQTEQFDRYIGNGSANIKIQIKGVPTSLEAASQFGYYPPNMSTGVLFDVADVTALVDAINNENADSASPLYGLISAGDDGGGNFNIEANVVGVKFEIDTIENVAVQQTNIAFHMPTDHRDFKMKVVVREGSVSYLETGDPATTINGFKIVQTQSFEICGRENIMNARIIGLNSTDKINYQIYVCQ